MRSKKASVAFSEGLRADIEAPAKPLVRSFSRDGSFSHDGSFSRDGSVAASPAPTESASTKHARPTLAPSSVEARPVLCTGAIRCMCARRGGRTRTRVHVCHTGEGRALLVCLRGIRRAWGASMVRCILGQSGAASRGRRTRLHSVAAKRASACAVGHARASVVAGHCILCVVFRGKKVCCRARRASRNLSS